MSRQASSSLHVARKFLIQPHNIDTLKLFTYAGGQILKHSSSDKSCFADSSPSGRFLGQRSVSSAFGDQENCFSESSDAIAECNERYRGILQIKDTVTKGQGLYADKTFHPNELVMSVRAKSIYDRRYSHSIQKDWQEHIEMELPAILINHCCDANIGILDNDKGAFDFIALREIKNGDELSWDYECSEYEISTPFHCKCGSIKCRGILRGFKYNRDDIKERYAPFYTSYLKDN